MIDRQRFKATATGIIAIALWAALALSTVFAKDLPPFELLALSFAVAFVSGLVMLAIRGDGAIAKLRQPLAAWMTAFLAIFLYHALYFFALAVIPPERASLIAYLWPLLIVLVSAMGPGSGRLQLRHLAGATLGFTGAAIIFVDRPGMPAPAGSTLGVLAAIGCAVVWSGYSVMNRRFAHVPSEMLIGVCGGVALAGGLVHLLIESTIPPTPPQALAILFLGVGPTGLAFLAWDHATKHGDVPLLGALSYLAPLLSTLLLVIAGKTPPTPLLLVSALLIVGGAMLAGCASSPRRSQ